MRIFLIKATKFFIALLILPMLPPMAATGWSLATRLSERTLYAANPLSLCLAGVILWVLFSLFFHCPARIYVFAHELSHALFIKLFGGRIKKVSIQKNQGYVISDRTNFLITLAPYIFPFYAILFGATAWISILLFPSSLLETMAWVGLGICMGYHWMMTAKMLTTRQTDFSSQGYFFSIVFVLWMNLGLFLLPLLILPQPAHFPRHCHLLWTQVQQTYSELFHQAWALRPRGF